jgi:alginate O-acetyltransferase complex protein AlgI
MLFNSLAFAIFLPIVFIIYWFVAYKNLRNQNILLLVASWVFYAWWDWRFLFLLISMALTNYIIGLEIGKNDNKKRKRIWLIAGLAVNLGALMIFKYFNFFINSFIDLISLTGYTLPKSSTVIILPLGISFYIFLSLSYLLDINKGTLSASRNIIEVLLSLSLFPIILAGPIQRPSSLLPQISGRREFSNSQAVNGLRQILWGLFTKVVIADNLGFYSNDIFLNYASYPGSTLFIGAISYTVQIYADFSGYSNIAIGKGKLFGISLMKNFAYPYFSRDITEFWKRWHISLTTWFRDYLFLPLSLRVSWKINSERVMNIKSDLFIYTVAGLITWFITGLWHGANYTFIIWGMIHGLFLIIYQWQKLPRKKIFKKYGISNDNIYIIISETIVTLAVVIIAWIFFRADSVKNALNYISGLFSGSFFSIPVFPYSRLMISVTALLCIIFFVIEWSGRKEQYPFESIGEKLPRSARWALYYFLMIIIFFFAGSQKEFIYFQF